MPSTPQGAQAAAVMAIQPGIVEANFRAPQVIQALRKQMAEEMRARGAAATVRKLPVEVGSEIIEQTPHGALNVPIKASEIGAVQPDPHELTLRGAWWHGMSGRAREKVMPIEARIPESAGPLPSIGEGGDVLAGHLTTKMGSNKTFKALDSYQPGIFQEPEYIGMSFNDAVYNIVNDLEFAGLLPDLHGHLEAIQIAPGQTTSPGITPKDFAGNLLDKVIEQSGGKTGEPGLIGRTIKNIEEILGKKLSLEDKTTWTAVDKAVSELHPSDMVRLGKKYGVTAPERSPLDVATEHGFPRSHHTPRLGEPAGVSLSAVWPVAKGFAADEYIHRVLPLYGGKPSEKVVNLMTGKGQKVLNDAYDVALNEVMGGTDDASKKFIKNLSNRLEWAAEAGSDRKSAFVGAVSGMSDDDRINRAFNTSMSKTMSDKGYRGMLYNPFRGGYSEYELLVFDPKHALPLDYRRASEYATNRPARELGKKQSELLKELNKLKSEYAKDTTNEVLKKKIDKLEDESVVIEQKMSVRPEKELTATPGAQKGIKAAEEYQGPQRLREIYEARPLNERLTDASKKKILDRIEDPLVREVVEGWLQGKEPKSIPEQAKEIYTKLGGKKKFKEPSTEKAKKGEPLSPSDSKLLEELTNLVVD